MLWLIPEDEPGLSHGGQFYQNKNGVVELPDHVDISKLGYKRAPLDKKVVEEKPKAPK